MARYSDLKRGPELAQAYTAYQAYLALDRTQKKAKYAALNVNRVVATRIKGNIAPFGSTTLLVPMLLPVDSPAPDTTTTPAEAKEADAPLVTLIRGILGNRTNVTPVDLDAVIEIPKFKAAKLFLTRRTSNTTSDKISRFTNISYKHRQTNTISCPFGKNAGGDTYDDAVSAIIAHASLKTHTDAGGKYRIVPQMSIIA